jgi:hypothetical protein
LQGDENFYSKFNSGAVSIPWQEEIIEKEVFKVSRRRKGGIISTNITLVREIVSDNTKHHAKDLSPLLEVEMVFVELDVLFVGIKIIFVELSIVCV